MTVPSVVPLYNRIRYEKLLRELEDLYFRYRMHEIMPHRDTSRKEDDTLRIVCSEVLR